MKKEDDQIYKKTPIKQSYIGVKKTRQILNSEWSCNI
jgi:hypothetical protein